MDLAALAGRTFEPRPFRICAENVADFVRATRSDSTRWTKAAPPGFVAAALFTVAPDLLSQLGDSSVIHGEQVFTWNRPMEIESQLEVTGSVTRIRERGGIYFVGFDATMAVTEDPVANASSLFLVFGGSELGAGGEERAEPAPHDNGSPGPGQVGASRADLIRYAAATRDWNPIHWDHGAAVAAGLPGVVVHGLLQAAWALDAASHLREGDRPLADARIRFRNSLLPAVVADLAMVQADGVAEVSIRSRDIEYLSARIELADG